MKKIMKYRHAVLAASISTALLVGCNANATKESTSAVVKAAPAAATTMLMGPAKLEPLGPPPIPADNLQSPGKIALGKVLFFDPRIGGDASTGCSTCHEPDQGWAWAEDFSRGYPGTVHWRNSQSIINSAYYPRLFWAGSASSLEKQARGAARGGVAGNGEADLMEARVALIPEYRKQFKEVFSTEWPLIKDVWRAIASYERTLVQMDTPIDNYLKGDKSALSEEQIRGKAIFEGKAGCIQCHNGPLATDLKFYNVGVPASPRWQNDGLAQITFRFEQYAKGMTQEGYRKAKDDWGYYYRSKNSWDKGKFRTPTLRYVVYTPPYLHNGMLDTLEEVVDFYNRGGKMEDGSSTTFPQTKSDLIKPLNLSDQEKEDLVAFIEAFSGEEILVDKPVLPDYAPLFTKAELEAAQEAK